MDVSANQKALIFLWLHILIAGRNDIPSYGGQTITPIKLQYYEDRETKRSKVDKVLDRNGERKTGIRIVFVLSLVNFSILCYSNNGIKLKKL